MKFGRQPQDYPPCVKLSFLIIPAFSALLLFCPAGLRAKPMSSGQAERMVKGWLKLDPNPLQTPLGNRVSQVNVFDDVNGEAIYYVIYLQPAGFVIVPADDLVEPIIAFADDGIFDPSPDNPLGALVSRDLPIRVAAARTFQAAAAGSQQQGTSSSQQAALEKTCFKAQGKWAELHDYSDMVEPLGESSISDVWVAPLLQSKWSQSNVCGEACYNYYTPGASYPPIIPDDTSNYVCGCVATAMAQYMRYWQYPTTGVGPGQCFTIRVDSVEYTECLRGGNGSGGPYNWSDMVLDPGCSTTPTQSEAIGALTFDAGVAAEMSYTSGSSGAGMHDATEALRTTFLYSNAICAYDFSEDGFDYDVQNNMINTNLDWGNPSLLAISGSSAGHAIVADGYGYNAATLYHHLNLGWAGSYDAWYNLPNIGTPYDFDVVDACIYNIYISGSGEIISGRVTDTSGNPISGATVTGVRTGGGTYNDTTDSNGIYALAKIPSSSEYTVSVTKTNYTFTDQIVWTGESTEDPPSWPCGNQWGIDFVGIPGPSPPVAESDTISIEYGAATTIDLQASDEGLPDPPGVLSYIISSLPNHGTLDDPCAGAINGVPYILASNGNQVVYSPFITHIGSDSFDFKANDGGTPPDGGDSNIATITINVQLPAPTVVYDTNFDGGLPAGWSIVDGGETIDTWTDTNPGGRSSSYWTGTFMIVDSDDAGEVDMNEQLITHSIDCSNLLDVVLKFKHDFVYYSLSNDEVADVDIRVNGGTWQNILRYQGASAEGQVELDLSSIADGDPNVQIRWHYYNANWEWYWGIDDVQLIAVTLPQPTPGDFEPDGDVDIEDLAVLREEWLCEELSADVWPDGGDGIVNFLDWAILAAGWQITVDFETLEDFTDQWLKTGANYYIADIAPAPDGDGIVNIFDFAVFAQNWRVGVE